MFKSRVKQVTKYNNVFDLFDTSFIKTSLTWWLETASNRRPESSSIPSSPQIVPFLEAELEMPSNVSTWNATNKRNREKWNPKFHPKGRRWWETPIWKDWRKCSRHPGCPIWRPLALRPQKTGEICWSGYLPGNPILMKMRFHKWCKNSRTEKQSGQKIGWTHLRCPVTLGPNTH